MNLIAKFPLKGWKAKLNNQDLQFNRRNAPERKNIMKTKLFTLFLSAVALFMLTGCTSTMRSVTESAGGKNLNLDGYVMLGELETANPETGTPNGKLIIGRVTYKSRKVGIPADQKVPTAGYFKSTKTKSLFGTEEEIIEYDFTAGSDADAERALKALEAKRKEAESTAESSEVNVTGNTAATK